MACRKRLTQSSHSLGSRHSHVLLFLQIGSDFGVRGQGFYSFLAFFFCFFLGGVLPATGLLAQGKVDAARLEHGGASVFAISRLF